MIGRDSVGDTAKAIFGLLLWTVSACVLLLSIAIPGIPLRTGVFATAFYFIGGLGLVTRSRRVSFYCAVLLGGLGIYDIGRGLVVVSKSPKHGLLPILIGLGLLVPLALNVKRRSTI